MKGHGANCVGCIETLTLFSLFFIIYFPTEKSDATNTTSQEITKFRMKVGRKQFILSSFCEATSVCLVTSLVSATDVVVVVVVVVVLVVVTSILDTSLLVASPHWPQLQDSRELCRS